MMSETYIPSPKGMIRAKNLEFETLKEDWNIYKLEDGTIIKAKLVVGQISRGINPETEEIYYIEGTGEPLYNIRSRNVVIAEVPKELLKSKPEAE